MDIAEKIALICKVVELEAKLPEGARLMYESKNGEFSTYLFAKHPEAGDQLVASGYSNLKNVPLEAFIEQVAGYCAGTFEIVAKQEGFRFTFSLQPIQG